MLERRREYHSDIEKLINKAKENIVKGIFEKALECLDLALKLDFNHKRVLTGQRYLQFWLSRSENIKEIKNNIESMEELLHYWKKFKTINTHQDNDEEFLQSFREYIFSLMLQLSEKLPNKHDQQFWQGIAHKGISHYDAAAQSLFQAMESNSLSARLLGELADTNALLGEDQKARALLREAFYLDAREVDIDNFESQILCQLIEAVKERVSLNADALREWVPIYGTIWGILNIKRELRALEFGKLRQGIFNYEQGLKADNKKPFVLPRLLNHYFWLIDHYLMNKVPQSKIDEILLKIQSASPEIYQLYISGDAQAPPLSNVHI